MGYLTRQDKEWLRTASIMWAAIAPHSKQHTTPRNYYKSIYDNGVDEITAEEYEQTCNAWGL